MFQEQLARLTANHLREHIKDYLDDISSEATADLSVPLLVPKRIDVSSVVGGLISEFAQILPQYGIDITAKHQSTDDSALWSYEYVGQINGLVHGGSREAVDLLISRHARAVEFFIKKHQFLHGYSDDNFKILEFLYVDTDFSGAEDISDSENTLWLAGFSMNVLWFTSEFGPSDHA